MKILVIGHAGSGKTTLARKIHSQFEVPYLELDTLWSRFGGMNLPREDVQERNAIKEKIALEAQDFIQKNSQWVIDGLYSNAQALVALEADKIFFIDIPLYKRQLNHIKRILFQKDRHTDIPLWKDIGFIFDMIRRTKIADQSIRKLAHEHTDKVVHVTSYKDLDGELKNSIRNSRN